MHVPGAIARIYAGDRIVFEEQRALEHTQPQADDVAVKYPALHGMRNRVGVRRVRTCPRMVKLTICAG